MTTSLSTLTSRWTAVHQTWCTWSSVLSTRSSTLVHLWNSRVGGPNINGTWWMIWGRTVVFVSIGHNATVIPQLISPVLGSSFWIKLMTQGHVTRTSLTLRNWRAGGWPIWAVCFPWTEPMAPINVTMPGQNSIGRTDHQKYHIYHHHHYHNIITPI